MKCLVFSDSHGNAANMSAVLSQHRDAEVVFFLGDGLADMLYLKEADRNVGRCRMYLPVRGNCDHSYLIPDSDVKKTDEIELLGKRIVYTHGDLYNAKYGDTALLYLAKERGADILLFGHTHSQYERYEDGVYLFNPGSIREGCFGILTIENGSILLSHGIRI